MRRPLKILVAGYVIGFPLGGMAYFALHYLLGLKRLGHEVMLIEDSGDWSYPFDPWRGTYDVDSSYGRGLLDRLLAPHGIPWAYYSAFEDKLHGVDEVDFDRFAAQADLFVNISGIIPLRERYMAPREKVLVATDPVFMECRAACIGAVEDYYRAHDHHFTFGVNLVDGHTPVPLMGLDWKPTLPPVCTDLWEPLPGPGRAWTTIGSWDTKDRDIVLDGKRYAWRKSVQYEKIIDLPMKVVPQVPFELAYSGMENAEAKYLARGWKIRSGMLVSRDIAGYRDYIRSSRGEFTVAKDQNVVLKSGWFSDRATCYLASGRPVITQDCGYADYLPVGQGLFGFETEEDILRAVHAVETNPDLHRAAARRIAEEHFEATTVMGRMLRDMGHG